MPMAAKVGLSAVSYGVGVQNRYSAFLDEDDGFGSPASQLPSITNGAVKSASVDNKKSGSLPRSSTNPKISGNKANNGKQDLTQKAQANANGQKNKVDLNKRQQKQPKSNQSQNVAPQLRPASTRQINHQNGAHNNNNQNKSVRNQQSHQENNDHDAANNSSGGRLYNRGQRDQRSNGRSLRQFNRGVDDEQRGNVNQDGNSATAGSFGSASEEEKLRRQQKRVNDSRHKDPEKREARRNRANSNAGDDQAHNVGDSNIDLEQSVENSGRARVFRNRREDDRVESIGARGFKNARGRVRRGQDDEEGGTAAQGERRTDTQQQDRRRFDGERSQRNRNGFGRGSGSRGSNPRFEGGNRAQERQKPIPNFSDKSDFPSLAS